MIVSPMPGTIHVAVLEFKGVSASSKPSAKSLKVSMGKRQYQTWDKGNFSFPITKIRENLVVALLDAGGNEIAHQDIGTMQIIEKGSWDEVFSINGGGHVHMKLHFTLSEADRDRIRVVRETVMKKKLKIDPNIKLRFQEDVTSTSLSVETSMKDEQEVSASAKGFGNIDLSSPKVEASQAASSPASSVISLSSHQMDGTPTLDSAIPNATDGSQDAPSSPVRRETEAEHPQVSDEKTETPQLARVRPDNGEAPSSSMLPRSSMSDKRSSIAPQTQGPVKKTPSSVRKMISAFENSQLQEEKTMKRAASVPSQLNKVRKESSSQDLPAETAVSPEATAAVEDLHQLPATVSGKDGNVLSDSEASQVGQELAATVRSMQSERTDPYAEDMSRASSSKEKLQEGEKSTVDLMRQSASETATSSGRGDKERSQAPQTYDLSSMLVSSSAAEGSGRGRGRGTGLKSSTVINIHEAPKTLEHYKEECHSAQSSGMWIFPDNTRRLCITTAGEQVMKVARRRYSEAKTHQANKISSDLLKKPKHEKEHKMEENSKKTPHQQDSGSASSPNDSTNGLIGQVIKIAVIAGFGVLVLLTRQKEPRKKHKEEKDNLFHVPDYVDERALKPWTGKQ